MLLSRAAAEGEGGREPAREAGKLFCPSEYLPCRGDACVHERECARRMRVRVSLCASHFGYICTMRERRSSNSDSIWSSSRFFSCAPLPLTTLCTENDSPQSALPVALPTMSAWRRCAYASVVLEPHRDACAVDRTERTGRTSIMRVWFADDSLSVALSPSVADNPPLPNTSNPAAAHVGLSVP